MRQLKPLGSEPLKTFHDDAARVLRNIRDTQTLVQVMDETFTDNHEMFVGIFEMLSHKLSMVESSHTALVELATQLLKPEELGGRQYQ